MKKIPSTLSVQWCSPDAATFGGTDDLGMSTGDQTKKKEFLPTTVEPSVDFRGVCIP